MCTIGIDFGTTSTRVAVWKDGDFKILSNEFGNKQTPSIVAFTKTHRFIGDRAKSQAAMNASNTIPHVKRMIGRNFSEPEVAGLVHSTALKFMADANGNVIFEWEFRENEPHYRTEEIYAMVLHKMKEIAEKCLECIVTGAVITVPSMFGNNQRQAVLDAGRIAGFECIRLINEPTAAAVAFGMDNPNNKKPMNLMVIHLGGGFFSASMIRITNGSSYQVIATVGDCNLGGEHFDECLMKHFLKEFWKKHSLEINDPKALRRLRTVCEQTKIRLSTNTEASLEIESFFDKKDLFSEISLEKFENICEHLFFRFEDRLEMLMKSPNVTNQSIDDVILVGGATRIPKIWKIVENIFTEKKINRTIHALDIAVLGATIVAAAEHEHFSTYLSSIRVKDIASYELVIEKEDEVLVEKNGDIPVNREVICTSRRQWIDCVINRGSAIEIHERIDYKNKKLVKIYSFDTKDHFKANISIDINGVISDIRAKELKRDYKKVMFGSKLPHLRNKDIQRMNKRINDLAQQDEQMRIFESAKSKMSDILLYWEQVAAGKRFPIVQKEAIKRKLVDEQSHAEKIGYQDIAEIEDRKKQLLNCCEEVLKAALDQEIPPWMHYFLNFQRKPVK